MLLNSLGKIETFKLIMKDGQYWNHSNTTGLIFFSQTTTYSCRDSLQNKFLSI